MREDRIFPNITYNSRQELKILDNPPFRKEGYFIKKYLNYEKDNNRIPIKADSQGVD